MSSPAALPVEVILMGLVSDSAGPVGATSGIASSCYAKVLQLECYVFPVYMWHVGSTGDERSGM